MNSLAHSTRVVSIVSKSFQIFFAAVLLVFLAGAASAQTFYADWTTTGSAFTHNFTLPDGTTGTVTKTETSCAVVPSDGAMSTGSVAHNSVANYPTNFYTPTPPDPLEFLAERVNRIGTLPGCGAATAIVANYVITFSETVANIRFHYINIDVGTVRFFDSAMTPINITRLNGNNAFEVAGNAVNTITPGGLNFGCETNAGANPFGGCGTMVVPGKYTQLRLTATDVQPSSGGDNFSWTMSINADYGDAPASYDNFGVGEASHDLLALNLRLGATVDADAAEKSGFSATGDDTTGIADEDGLIQFPSGGGLSCTGTLGTYTTLANEYCAVISVTNTGATAAQLVGWLDGDGNGDFLGPNDRSVPLNHPAVDDGTFATGNIPAGVTRNMILVWTGLPPAFPSTTYVRFRVTRDAAFLSDPSPLGAMIDGEVEDYAIFEPTAANVSISGRVLTPVGSGVMNARVVLTDSQGISRMVVTNPFGYFRLDGVPAGETYVVSVFSKGYQFEPLAIAVVDDITGLDIIALK